MVGDTPQTSENLSAEQRQRFRFAHTRLRNASQAIEALVATEPIRGRWLPEPAPREAIEAAKAELEQAYRVVEERHRELLG